MLIEQNSPTSTKLIDTNISISTNPSQNSTKPSLWADYFREKGLIVVETEKGFMSAYVHNNVCMVDNFYVRPDLRGSRAAIRLTNEVIRLALIRGCHTFCAEIYKIDPLYDYILRLHRHFGMLPVEDTEFKTVTAKSIGAPC